MGQYQGRLQVEQWLTQEAQCFYRAVSSVCRITRGSPAPLAALASRNPALSVTAPAIVPGLSIEDKIGRRPVPGAGFVIREIVIRPGPGP